jgi:hypothetical protein
MERIIYDADVKLRATWRWLRQLLIKTSKQVQDGERAIDDLRGWSSFAQ